MCACAHNLSVHHAARKKGHSWVATRFLLGFFRHCKMQNFLHLGQIIPNTQSADHKFPHCNFIKNHNKNTIYWCDRTAISTIPGNHKLNAGPEPCAGGPHIVSVQGIPHGCHQGLQGIHWWVRSRTCHPLDFPPYAVIKQVQIGRVGGGTLRPARRHRSHHCLVSIVLLHNLGFVGRCRILLLDNPLPGKVGLHPWCDHHLEHLQVVLCLQPDPILEPGGFHDMAIWGNSAQHHDTGWMLGPHDGWDIPWVKGQPAVIAGIAGLVHCPGLLVQEELDSEPIALGPGPCGLRSGLPSRHSQPPWQVHAWTWMGHRWSRPRGPPGRTLISPASLTQSQVSWPCCLTHPTSSWHCRRSYSHNRWSWSCPELRSLRGPDRWYVVFFVPPLCSCHQLTHMCNNLIRKTTFASRVARRRHLPRAQSRFPEQFSSYSTLQYIWLNKKLSVAALISRAKMPRLDSAQGTSRTSRFTCWQLQRNDRDTLEFSTL